MPMESTESLLLVFAASSFSSSARRKRAKYPAYGNTEKRRYACVRALMHKTAVVPRRLLVGSLLSGRMVQ